MFYLQFLKNIWRSNMLVITRKLVPLTENSTGLEKRVFKLVPYICHDFIDRL